MSSLDPHSRQFYVDLAKEAADDTDPRPYPWGVLYVKPSKSKERRNCGNCWKWTADKGCLDFKGDMIGKVEKVDVCGLHVHGQPRLPKWADFGQDTDIKLAGFEKDTSTACDNCRHSYVEDKQAYCRRVKDAPGADAKIEARGCCAAWEKK